MRPFAHDGRAAHARRRVGPLDRQQPAHKHLATRRRRSGALIVALVAMVGGGIATGAVLARNRPVRHQGCPPDVVALTVVSSPETSAILKQAAADYARSNPTVVGRCVQVRVADKPAAAAANALAVGWNNDTDGPRPDVWVPSSSAWAGLLSARLAAAKQPDIVPQDHPSIATSPLVMAMPRPMATLLGWPSKPIGWSELLKVLRPLLPDATVNATLSTGTWAPLGHPEWGRFLVGKTDANQSNPGLESLLGTFYVAAAQAAHGTLSAQTAADPNVQAFALALQRTPGPLAATSEALLTNLQDADDQGKALTYLSMAALDEKSVLDYNQGNPSGDPATLGRHPKPKVPLVAVYPKDGTLAADHPYLALDVPWVDADKRQAATDFLHYLQSGPVQTGFQAIGFRSFSGVAGDQASEANGLIAGQPTTVLPPPPAPLIETLLNGYNASLKTANILALLDVSGSMNQVVPGTGGKTKLDVEKAAAIHGLELFHGATNGATWVFSSNLDGTKDYRPISPFGAVDQDLGGGHTGRELGVAAIARLQAHGDTGLYDAIAAARAFLQAHYTPGRINAVVVMTDGVNDDPTGGISLPQLLQQLKAGQDTRPVRVIGIGFGADADMKALGAIAAASNGGAFFARNPADIDKVFLTALSRF